jgi:hypothetical protein
VALWLLVSVDSRFEFSGWAIDPRFRSAIAREGVYRDANGNIDPSRVNLASQGGDVLGLPAQFGRAVGGDLGASTDSGIRIIGGDFGQLRYGFADQIRVKVTDTASLTDGSATVSMWQTNQVAILIEVTFGWLLGDKEGFVKFANTGNASYTASTNGSTGGTFTLSVDGVATSAIAYNATAATVKTALVALDDGYDTNDVTVTGSAGGPYTITVPGLLTGNGASLTGGSPAATLTVAAA